MQQSGTCEALVAAPGRVAAVQAVPSPSRWELHVSTTGLGLGTLLRTAVPAVCTYVEQPVRVPGPGPHAGLNVGRRPVTQPRVWPESRTGNMGAEEANSSSAGPEPT